MIISASRRTDIPAYYSEWFFNRIKEGFVLVRNPMNFRQISKINLSSKVVDAIVFWTKNPAPMIDRLDELKDYKYYFQFTLNPYGKDIEYNVPSKSQSIIPTFIELSKKIGKDKVIWRYDPIFINKKYTVDYHVKYFKLLMSRLYNYTEKCTISFLDYYKSIEKNISKQNIISPSANQQIEIAEKFSEIAEEYGVIIDTCAENSDFDKYNIKHASCIDKERIEKICGYKLKLNKDKNQREACTCVESVDIGMYNTCKNACVYCYANHSEIKVNQNYNSHNPLSPLLCGTIEEKDIIKERDIKTNRIETKIWD